MTKKDKEVLEKLIDYYGPNDPFWLSIGFEAGVRYKNKELFELKEVNDE